jgi:coenzyme F420 hydrogenase subunit beta
MKACETVMHLRREEPRRMKHMVPANIWNLVAPYGVVAAVSEMPGEPGQPRARTHAD